MKKTIKSLLALAITALAMTACSDVPEPYQIPGTGGNSSGGEDIAGATGSGQLTDPYNCIAANATGGTTDWVYIKGKVSSIKEEYSTQFGNGTFYISDDGTRKNEFYVYRAYYLGNKKFANGDEQIKVGDEVIVCGIITNYNGTIETTQNKGFIYELNGVNRGGDPTGGDQTGGEQKGTGTESDPFNVAAAVAKCKAVGQTASAESYYIKGIADADYTVDNYKNVTVDIVDKEGSSEKFTVYRVKAANNTNIKEGFKIAKGATIVVYGKVINYKGNTPETVQNEAHLVSVNGLAPEVEGGSDTPTPTGNGEGTEAKPYDVPTAIAKGEQAGVYLKAYIVGFVDGQVYAEGATFSDASTSQTNILIAASPDETNAAKCMPVQLPTGDIRTKLNLKDNAGNYKKEVLLYGDITKYFSVPGIKNTSYAVIDGNAIGTKPGGSDTPSGDVKTVSIADFNAAPESDNVWYQLTGTVKNLKDNDQYGNFDLEDATGSVYVYGLLSEKGGAKKLFQELVAAKGIANGSKITIIGLRSSYNGNIQVKNAYFVRIEGGSSSSGSGADGSTIISVADFNAAPESTTVWYQLTGTIKNLKDGDLYGNFDLEDNTGSVYVYGVLSEKGGAKKLFQELVAAKGIANGKKITIVGNRGSYNGKVEVTNAYFIKVE